MKTSPNLRLIPCLGMALAATQLCSCVQPPPPRTYNPKVSRHLRELSHDTPVTPIPSAYGGWGYYGYHPYWGY